MKNSTISLLSIVLGSLLAVGILLATVAGFLYIGVSSWESGWAMGDSIQARDGYTYCMMYETGIMQDPDIKLIRTRDIKNEETYEDLGSTGHGYSYLTVIRPSKALKIEADIRYLPVNNVVYGISCRNNICFIYDINNGQFSDKYDSGQMSPFILIEPDDTKLHKSDILQVLSRIAEESASTGEKTLAPWPSSKALKEAMNHPNEQVRKLSMWITVIQEHGLSNDPEINNEIIELLYDKDIRTQQQAIEALEHIKSIKTPD